MTATILPVNGARGAGTAAVAGMARIYADLLSSLPGLTLPVARIALFSAVDEFCTRSCFWRQTVEWSMVEGQRSTDLNPISETVYAAWIWRVDGLHRYRIQNPAILVDTGDRSQDRYGTALVVCKPARLNDFELPSALIDQWAEGLIAGAKARLHYQMAKPWSDAKAATFWASRFKQQLSLARETARGAGDLPRPRFPYYAGGSQGSSGFGAGGIACTGTINCGCPRCEQIRDGGAF